MATKVKPQNAPLQKKQRYIYVADDDADDRDFFVDAVRAVDSSVVLKQAEDGIELMNIITASSEPLPEVLFLDINMPRKSGFDCLQEIRNQKGIIKDVNVIMLSTSNDPDTIQKAKELGANFYAVKPNNFETLISFLSDVLNIDWQCSEQQGKNFRLI